MSRIPRRLYRLYNIKQGAWGQPFAMCDYHYKDYKPPATCIIEKIADSALWDCNGCWAEEEESIDMPEKEPEMNRK